LRTEFHKTGKTSAKQQWCGAVWGAAGPAGRFGPDGKRKISKLSPADTKHQPSSNQVQEAQPHQGMTC